MSVLAKVLIAISAVFSLVFLGMSATVYHWATDYRAANEKLQAETLKWKEKTKELIDGLRSQISDLESVNDARQAEVRAVKDQFDNLKNRFDQLQDEKNRLDARYDEEKLQNKNLAETVKSQEDRIRNLSEQLEQKKEELDIANRDKKTAEDQVARLMNIEAALRRDLSELRKEYQAASQKVKDLQLVIATLEEQGVPVNTIVAGHPPVKAVSGVVVAVRNDLDPPLVLLSVGKDDGVEIGYQFTVYRGGEFIGRVVVEKVMADVSGARVLFTADGARVTEGDNATTRLQ